MERLARLKSTLTFEDGEREVPEVSRRVTRIDEEDSEALELEESAPTSPMLAPAHPALAHELVLSPAKLQNGE